MIKQISTYGAALLTVMVVIRAATMEDQKDVSNLYQRTADLTYVDDNLALREHYITADESLNSFFVSNVRSEYEIPKPKSIPTFTAKSDEDLAATRLNSIDSEEIDPSNLILLNEKTSLTGSENLSLDRESTINTGLSAIFNRERIHPKPVRVSLEE